MRKRKKNSRRPDGAIPSGHRSSVSKRIVVFSFGLTFVAVTLWSLTKNNLSVLLSWHYILIAFMVLFGIYLMLIVFVTQHRAVNESHDHITDAVTRNFFRQLLEKLLS
jgi:TRAP-type C4-dicarboxylate transport system permease small subunit